MANKNAKYSEELNQEVLKLDENYPHAKRLLAEEIKRVESGDKYKHVNKIDVSQDKPCSVAVKLHIPVNEHPKYNFVGKLLGPKGATLKRLQDETGCKLSILGRGSIRDKAKEEECRKEGGKYAHLNDQLHLMVECFTEPSQGFARLSHAVAELKPFMIPDIQDEFGMQQPMQSDMRYMPNGGEGQRGRGRGGMGGAPPMRGGDRGRGGLLSTPSGRGGPRGGGMSAGGDRGRGAPRGAGMGGRGTPRGGRGGMAPRGRGAAAPAPRPTAYAREPVYDDYSTAAYEDQNQSYQDDYNDNAYANDSYLEDTSYSGRGQSSSSGYRDERVESDTQYFDYGHGTQTYDDYGNGGGYGGSSGLKSQSRGAGSRGGQYRTHPYAGGQGSRGHY